MILPLPRLCSGAKQRVLIQYRSDDLGREEQSLKIRLSTVSQSCSGISTEGLRRLTPATLTRISICPMRLRTSRTSPGTSATREISAANTSARAPWPDEDPFACDCKVPRSRRLLRGRDRLPALCRGKRRQRAPSARKDRTEDGRHDCLPTLFALWFLMLIYGPLTRWEAPHYTPVTNRQTSPSRTTRPAVGPGKCVPITSVDSVANCANIRRRVDSAAF